METTVNKIVPHEDIEMEVHIHFLDESHRPHPEANVIVFIEKQDYPLSEVRVLRSRKRSTFCLR